MKTKVLIPYVSGHYAQIHGKIPKIGDLVVDLDCEFGDIGICVGQITNPKIIVEKQVETEYEIIKSDFASSNEAKQFAHHLKAEIISKKGEKERPDAFFRYTNGATDWEPMIPI
jgi:hypothetical protein